MSWRQALRTFLHSGTVISMVGGLVVTGCYVIYKDGTRYTRMMDTYARGNILPPLAENVFETVYFRRHNLEQNLRRVLRPTFSNEYFIINGDVGTGKTRTLVELTRQLIESEGRRHEGAPVYVLAHQGSSFPDILASAVNFRFDEHISFKFFVDFVMRIHSIPERDEGNRLTRVLDAIESSSFMYMQRTGRPVVIVIDGIDHLSRNMPGVLERLQEKAKLWADTNTVKMIFVNNDEETESLLQKKNTVKMIFVNNDEETESLLQKNNTVKMIFVNNSEETESLLQKNNTVKMIFVNNDEETESLLQKNNTVKMIFVNNSEETESLLQKNASCWSRLATPIIVEDLTEDEAVNFLVSDTFMEQGLIVTESSCSQRAVSMPLDRAKRIVDLVGGRMLHLIEFKRAWIVGVDFEETAQELKDRERQLLLRVQRDPAAWRLISELHSAPNKTALMQLIVKKASVTDIYALAHSHVIRLDRDPVKGLVVKFRSRLTSNVVGEIQRDLAFNGV